MRVPRSFLFLLAVFLLPIPLLAQASSITQDARALNVLNQALTAGGGAQAIAAISDYTGTGNITYYPGGPTQGTVTVIGTSSQEFRMDATVPSGLRSWAVHDGIVTTKNESGTIDSFGANVNLPSSKRVSG